jgi:hypothetical protein
MKLFIITPYSIDADCSSILKYTFHKIIDREEPSHFDHTTYDIINQMYECKNFCFLNIRHEKEYIRKISSLLIQENYFPILKYSFNHSQWNAFIKKIQTQCQQKNKICKIEHPISLTESKLFYE